MAEPEYADFSDMQEAQLPDEVETPNTQVQYLEEPPVETPQETIKEEPKEKENPESYKYFQSLADKRHAELMEEKRKREQLEREIENIKSQSIPKKEEPLTPPQRPQKPTGDDPLDMIRYNQDLAEYLNNVVEYQNKLNEQRFQKSDQYFQQLETERQARIQQEEIARQRAWQTSQLVQAGLSPDEATQALADYSKDAETPEQYFKDLAEFWKFRKGLTPKPSKVEQRANRQQALPPLGTTPSVVETQKADPSDDFFNDMKGFIGKNY